MTTKEELATCLFTSYDESEDEVSLRTSQDEMDRFASFQEFRTEVSSFLDEYVKQNHIKPKYEKLAELMETSESSIKDCCYTGKRQITRHFLYKMCIGLHLPMEKAEEFILHSGSGPLSRDCKEDLVFINALNDGDGILDFINEFNGYFPDRKLKKLR